MRWLAAFLRDFFGPVEFSEAVHRRGHLGSESICPVCLRDVHDLGEMCPDQRAADCAICGPVLLDYYGCPGGGVNHQPTNIRPVTEWQWKAMQREQRRLTQRRVRR